jgi:serine/threonine protein kinase/TolB-like protein/Tfp pilus assembly protein PilF
MALSPGTRLGTYEIVAPIGAGGMGEVYRARDGKLDRDVAIKVLPESVAADREMLARFEREAKAVAALSHPHILAIHDFGTEGGVAYAVMELLEGQTVRARLDAGPLTEKEAVDYALQVAKGLSAAHEKGIIHRDLKPENLFVSKEGHLKILDFGLAKRIAMPAEGVQTAQTVTRGTETGAIMGTVGYMSPEQVRGLSVDHRSDIFSFGTILYELLSGERAFSRQTAGDTLAAILLQDPPDLSESGRNISPAVERTVRRCLEKDRDNRFQSVKEATSALSEASTPTAPRLVPLAPEASPTAPTGSRRVLIAAAVVIALALTALVGVLFLRPSSTDEVASGLEQAATAAARRVVAVRPFKNISRDLTQNYFSAGMTEEIRGQLSKLAALRLLSGSAVERYRDDEMRRMVEELGVGSIVEGSVRLDGQRVRIGVQLVDAHSEQSLWSEQYDRGFQDLLAVQSDVALRIADALHATLSPDERQRVEKPPTENLAAYDLYLRSQAFNSSDLAKNREAIEMLRKALAMDPRFARAQAAMAYRTLFLGYFEDTRHFDVALGMAEAALKLDSTLSSAHSTKAAIYMSTGRVAEAKAAFHRAIELDPNDPRCMNNLSILELDLGHYEDSLHWAKRAFQLNPNSGNQYYHVGWPLLLLGDDKASERWLVLAKERFPSFARIDVLLAWLDYQRGDEAQALARARRLVEIDPTNEEAVTLLGEMTFLTGSADAASVAERSFKSSPAAATGLRTRYANLLMRRGEQGRAEQLLDEAAKAAKKALDEGDQSSRVRMELAAIHATREETEVAMGWLERAYEAGYREGSYLARNPMFQGLREDRRFLALVARMRTDVAEMRQRARANETLPVPPPLRASP